MPEVLADPTVERGGCILDVGPARVDAQLSAAVARVRAELEGAELVRPTDTEATSLPNAYGPIVRSYQSKIWTRRRVPAVALRWPLGSQ